MGLVGKTKGYFRSDGPDGAVEGETFTCPHCNAIKVIDRTKAPPGICEHCWAPVCGAKACQTCVPFEKKLEAMERGKARAVSRSSILRAAGIE